VSSGDPTINWQNETQDNDAVRAVKVRVITLRFRSPYADRVVAGSITNLPTDVVTRAV